MGAHHTGPTIVLEASAGAASPAWAWVQPALAEHYRVVAYDRPGLGWSEARPGPFDPEHNAEQLHTALAQRGIDGPYILVGHSMGGLFARIFAGRYPEEVAALVLVEPSHPDQTARHPALAKEQADFSRLLRWLPWLARLGLTRVIDMSGTQFAGLPDAPRAALGRFLASTRHIETMVAEMDGFERSATVARGAGTLADRPLVVLSGAQSGAEAVDPAAYRAGWHGLHAELATLSSRGVHRVVADAGHTSILYAPAHAQTVVAAITEVAAAVGDR